MATAHFLVGILNVMNEAPATGPATFETSLEQLQAIVHDLEEGQLGLETSLARFEEGVRLLRSCYQILEQAEQRISVLTGLDSEGKPTFAPFDATATIEAGEKAGKRPGRRRAAPGAEASAIDPKPAGEKAQRLF